MPDRNRFRHQAYQGGLRHLEQILAPEPVAVESADFKERMARVGEAYRRAGVTGILLVHGSFVGTDASGAIREVSRLSPSLAEALRNLEKQAVDHFARDAGNYTEQYARVLEDALEAGTGRRIPVCPVAWSGENHHVGRADGAMRVLDALKQQGVEGPSRWLLWAHSHGGNVLALVTNLLANERQSNERFFRAARCYYRWPLLQQVDVPLWPEVRRQLSQSVRPWDRMSLDMVTFGTPVRYGWDTRGTEGLLHFTYHRSRDGGVAASFPPSMEEIVSAAGGDLWQQLGIAGTNFPPTLWAWRAWRADHRLSRVLQRGIRSRDLLDRLRLGQRLHEDGQNLLVDYGSADELGAQPFSGHAVYTRRRWMLFHAEEIASRLYGMRLGADNV